MDEIVEQMNTLNRVEHDAIEKAFRELLRTEAGKRVIYWMLEQSAMYEAAYTGDPASTNFMLGKQEVGRRIIGQLDVIDAKFYPQLLMSIAEIRALDRATAEALDRPKDEDDDEAP